MSATINVSVAMNSGSESLVFMMDISNRTYDQPSASLAGMRFLSFRGCEISAAVAVFAAAGVFIWRRRHQFFDRDPEVEDDGPVARHNRQEVIGFVWSGLTLVLLVI